SGADVITAATPLVTGNASYRDLLLGNTGGCIGETCAIALILGGVYLMIRRIISPATPLAFLGTVALLNLIAGNDVLYQLLSGGLMLGAFFMATDYVTTPITWKGKLVFGMGCGVMTFLIRQFGGYPEGVSFSILLMNILTPYIDRFTMTSPLGAVKPEKEGKSHA
ncbi:RnfABCDGE type electron transport complex subunit D, partial [Ruminococcus sp.]